MTYWLCPLHGQTEVPGCVSAEVATDVIVNGAPVSHTQLKRVKRLDFDLCFKKT